MAWNFFFHAIFFIKVLISHSTELRIGNERGCIDLNPFVDSGKGVCCMVRCYLISTPAAISDEHGSVHEA